MKLLLPFRILLRILDTFREKKRWKQKFLSRKPQVYYGQKFIPGRTELLSGGLVKLQDLCERFPNCPDRPNILYLISSGLPPHPDLLVRYASKAGVPIILNQNGVAYPAWHGPGWEQTNQRLSAIYRHASHIIFQSQFCQMSAHTFLGQTDAPSSILHNPVDTDSFLPPSFDRRPAATTRLLVAGSHNFFYKIQVAIDTLAWLRKHGVACTLQIAGRYCWHNSLDECQKEVQHYASIQDVHDHVSLSGSYTQLEAVGLLQHTDILLHPTYNDSCPRLVSESLSCGTPVVYSATGGTPELVAATAGIGIRGSIDWDRIQPPPAEQLGDAVLQIRNNYRAFSQGARNHAVEHLGKGDWLTAHGEIFKRVLTTHASV